VAENIQVLSSEIRRKISSPTAVDAFNPTLLQGRAGRVVLPGDGGSRL
jgi:hypothetical protein